MVKLTLPTLDLSYLFIVSLVELFDAELEPPVWPHEGQCHRDLGVHQAQEPILTNTYAAYPDDI